MAAVNIPDPCSRKPESMVPVSGGFYCDSCCKVVVDFREKTNEEILIAIRNSGDGKLCGYLNKSQATRGGKLKFQMARFAAALLVVFGSLLFVTSTTGCGGGLVEQSPADSIQYANQVALQDSVLKANLIQSKIDSINSTKNAATDLVQWSADSATAVDSLSHAIDPVHYPKK